MRRRKIAQARLPIGDGPVRKLVIDHLGDLLKRVTNLSPKYQALCRRAGLFDLSQVLCKSPNELCGVLRLDDVQQAEWLLDQLAVEMLDGNGAIEAKGKAKEAVGLAVDTVLSTGDADLDTLLRGGLPVGMLTELVGESSSGKTQLAIQMAVYTAMGSCAHCVLDDGEGNVPSSSRQRLCDCDRHRSPGTVALILSEGNAQGHAFVRRMEDIVRGIVEARRNRRRGMKPMKRKFKSDEDRDSDDCLRTSLQEEVEQIMASVLANIRIARVSDLEALEHALQYILPGLAESLSGYSRGQPLEDDVTSSLDPTQISIKGDPVRSAPLRLIILDSLPAVFYAEQLASMNAMVARSKALCNISDGLKRVASVGRNEDGTGGAAVIVVNHVSDAFEKDVAFLQAVAATATTAGRAESRSNTTSTSTSQSQSSQSRRSGPPPRPPRNEPPPLIFAQQAPFFSGLLSSFHGSRIDDGHSTQLQLAPPRSEGFPTLKQAALGQVWNNCINARIMINKTGAYVHLPPRMRAEHNGKSTPLPLCKLSVVFAPHLPPNEAALVIAQQGICSLSISDVQGHLVHPRRERDDDYHGDDTAQPHTQRSRRFSEEEDAVWTQFDRDVKGEDLEAVMGQFEAEEE